MWFARLSRALPPFLEAYPKTRWLFLTLTVKNCDISELKQTCSAMGKGWERLSKLKAFPGFAWFRSLEVTRGVGGSAHPHYHVLLAVTPSYFTGKKYLSQEKWVELWRKSARLDYDPIVDIRVVKPKKSVGEQDLSQVSAKVLVEVAKYEVKPDDLLNFNDSAWVCELAKQLKGVRSINIGGPLRQFLKEDEPEDLISENVDDVPQEVLNALVFGWKEHIQRYRLKSFS
jgi:plasmid rolling circle replication initiator protein Rep